MTKVHGDVCQSLVSWLKAKESSIPEEWSAKAICIPDWDEQEAKLRGEFEDPEIRIQKSVAKKAKARAHLNPEKWMLGPEGAVVSGYFTA